MNAAEFFLLQPYKVLTLKNKEKSLQPFGRKRGKETILKYTQHSNLLGQTCPQARLFKESLIYWSLPELNKSEKEKYPSQPLIAFPVRGGK